MLGIIALVAVVAVAVILIIAARKPNNFSIVRRATMTAPPDRIFPYINDLSRNIEWSPLENKDPNMKRTFTGPACGVGALYEFSGNNQVGAGRIAILESAPSSKVKMTLDMTKPMKANNVITYTLAPKGAETEVSWAMEGSRPFFIKVMCIFFDMDGMVGKEFEKGLATLKTLVEK